MNIEHIAIWVNDLEAMKAFYEKYFKAKSGELYHNPLKKFKSYFLSFEEGARLELMHNPKIKSNENSGIPVFGLAHMAISVGSKEDVDSLTELFRSDGIIIESEPRLTGDGY